MIRRRRAETVLGFAAFMALMALGLAVARYEFSNAAGSVCYEGKVLGAELMPDGSEVDHIQHALPTNFLDSIETLPIFPFVLICTAAPDSMPPQVIG